MIASILTLKRSDFKALKLYDAYSIHRVIYSLFPKQEKGRDFLFADKGGDFMKRQILIISNRKPETPAYGHIESKNIPNSFLECDDYGFEIKLNPVKREKQSGKLVPIGDGRSGMEKKQILLDWFNSKSKNWGFIADHNSLFIRDTDVQTFAKENYKITQNAVTFTGKFKVTNRNLFIKSFEEGIGRGKAFGFGLLQIVPLKEDKTNLKL